jgi:hypothetical protein
VVTSVGRRAAFSARAINQDRFVEVALANWIEFIGPALAVSDPI